MELKIRGYEWQSMPLSDWMRLQRGAKGFRNEEHKEQTELDQPAKDALKDWLER